MKKHILIITIIVLSGVLTTASAIDNYTTINKNSNNIEETTKTENMYVVKDYKGRIAVFYNDNQIPKEIFNIYTDSLPQEDAQKIKSGVRLSENELNSFIADYTS